MKQNKLREVCLEITSSCPMNCVHCSSFDGFEHGDDMSHAEIKRTITEIADLGGEVLEISGGEPLVHPRIIEIVDYAKRCGLETRLYTSGFPLNRAIRSKLIASRLDKIIFNLQGATPRNHEYITQTAGSFGKVIEGIKQCVDDFWVAVHFVPMKPNFRELGKVIKLCSDLDVDEVAILRFVPQGRGHVNRSWLELSSGEFRKLIEDLIHLYHRFGNIMRIGNPMNFCSLIDNSIPSTQCHAALSSCSIKPNGDVVPCPAFKQNSNYVAGNVRRDSLTAIWRFSPVLIKFRHFNYRKLKKPCRSCKFLPLCKGRCVAQRILAFKRTTASTDENPSLQWDDDIYQGPDPHCFLYEPKLMPLIKHHI